MPLANAALSVQYYDIMSGYLKFLGKYTCFNEGTYAGVMRLEIILT